MSSRREFLNTAAVVLGTGLGIVSLPVGAGIYAGYWRRSLAEHQDRFRSEIAQFQAEHADLETTSASGRLIRAQNTLTGFGHYLKNVAQHQGAYQVLFADNFPQKTGSEFHTPSFFPGFHAILKGYPTGAQDALADLNNRLIQHHVNFGTGGDQKLRDSLTAKLIQRNAPLTMVSSLAQDRYQWEQAQLQRDVRVFYLALNERVDSSQARDTISAAFGQQLQEWNSILSQVWRPTWDEHFIFLTVQGAGFELNPLT
jgi:preprotein translocase subunit Sss1